ncbi:MAG: GntR family transcriptional regulator [Lachnospiraceae bacterium]
MAEENFQTAADLAYQIISQKILDGEYEPGMKLSRRKMAEATGVSVIPVIEALKRLEEDHLVESKPKWGSFVTMPTKQKIRESYQLREAIEAQSARYLALHMTQMQQDELMLLATELDTVPYMDSTVSGSRNSHVLFHTKLTEFTGNHLLMDTLRKINLFWILCQALSSNAPQQQYPRYWHRYLIDIIAKGDPEEADRVMREHVNNSLESILATVEL